MRLVWVVWLLYIYNRRKLHGNYFLNGQDRLQRFLLCCAGYGTYIIEES